MSERFPQLAINSDIGKRALESFYKLRQKGILTNKWQIKDALSCLYFEIKKHFPHSTLSNISDPRIAENFCQFVRLNFGQEYRPLPNQKALKRNYRIIVREQWQNFPTLVREICQNMKLDKKVLDGAVELAEQMQKKQIQSQRDPFYLTAGLIYVAARWVEGKRRGSKFTLNRLATQFITNPTTISQAARYVLDNTNPIVLLNQQKLFPYRPPMKYFTGGFLFKYNNLTTIK